MNQRRTIELIPLSTGALGWNKDYVEFKQLMKKTMRITVTLWIGLPALVGWIQGMAFCQEWELGNDRLELNFRRAGDRVIAYQLVNKLSGRTIPLSADDFFIGIDGRPALCADDFVFQEANQESTAHGRRLIFLSSNVEAGIDLRVNYELGFDDCFLRRSLELHTNDPLPLRDVDMWLIDLKGECIGQEQGVPVYLQLGPEWQFTTEHHGFGYPVFMEDTFWGLEYPSGYNHYENGRMTLRHFPGRTVTGRFTSKTAVLGVAENGHVAQRFREYLQTIIGVRSTPSLYFAWKTWVTLMPPTEVNCVEMIETFRRCLFGATGARFDNFALDDGWDKKQSLWDIDANRFPNGFGSLIDALQPMKTDLGLWMSPSTGYDHADWAAAHGYKKNAWSWLLCQSDPHYRRDMVKAITSLAERYDVNYFKFDAFCAPCDAERHDHHLPGNYAKEANTDAYLELLAAVRQARPDSFINLTTGTWASPWWLQFADSVWDQVYDGWSPGIAPTPELSYSQITDRDAVSRKRAQENPWFPAEAFENLGIWTQNFRYIDEQIMTILGRGGRLISFYYDPRQGGERDWQFLGSAMNWARRHEDTLCHTKMILGDPRQLEPYGYAHYLRDEGILVLRNSFISPQMVKLKLDDSIGWIRTEAEKQHPRPFVAQIVYPYHQTFSRLLHYGDELSVELNAYEMLFIQLKPLENHDPVLLGARFEETERSEQRVSYTVYGQSGGKQTVPLVASIKLREVKWNGQPISPKLTDSGFELSLILPGTQQACRVEGGRISARLAEQRWVATGQSVVQVQEGTHATMHLMWAYPEALHPPAVTFLENTFHQVDDAAEKAALREQAEKLTATKPRCWATINGVSVEVKMNDSKLYRPTNVGDHRMYAEYPPAPWVWFQFELPAGQSEIMVTIECSMADSLETEPVLGWWIWTENPLAQGTLTIEFDTPLPTTAIDPLPLPIRINQQRVIHTFQPPIMSRAGK